jgi:hypothetical protein
MHCQEKRQCLAAMHGCCRACWACWAGIVKSAHLCPIVANVFIEKALRFLLFGSGCIEEVPGLQGSPADGTLCPPLYSSAHSTPFSEKGHLPIVGAPNCTLTPPMKHETSCESDRPANQRKEAAAAYRTRSLESYGKLTARLVHRKFSGLPSEIVIAQS